MFNSFTLQLSPLVLISNNIAVQFSHFTTSILSFRILELQQRLSIKLNTYYNNMEILKQNMSQVKFTEAVFCPSSSFPSHLPIYN